MATDIVLDDKAGDCITVNCDELATGGFIAIDNPASRSVPGGVRVALRHEANDSLGLNPDGAYPLGVSIRSANLNLRVIERREYPPELPMRAEMGDLLFVRSIVHRPSAGTVPGEIVEHCTLWACIGPAIDGRANWAPIPLGISVTGTV